MSVLLYVFQGVFPVFLLIVCGWYLKQRKVINDAFLSASSMVGFKLGMPALVFLKIAPLDFSRVFDIREILIICGLTAGSFILAFLLSGKIPQTPQKGAFVQGAFRGNVAIIGIALILNLYGEEMMARGAMVLAFLLPLFNVLAVVALTVPFHGLSARGLLHAGRNIVTNPIILSVTAAIVFSLFRLPVPLVMERFLGYLSDLALPLALINIGGSLSYSGIKIKGRLALAAASLKIILLPVIGVIIFYSLGYRGEELGMIFLITGAPTAVSSHIMAQAMDNDGELAALIVMMTTAGAAVTTMAGISIIEMIS